MLALLMSPLLPPLLAWNHLTLIFPIMNEIFLVVEQVVPLLPSPVQRVAAAVMVVADDVVVVQDMAVYRIEIGVAVVAVVVLFPAYLFHSSEVVAVVEKEVSFDHDIEVDLGIVAVAFHHHRTAEVYHHSAYW